MRLYALLDETSLQKRGWSHERFVERAVTHGAKLLQYRNKDEDIELVREKLEAVVSLFPGRVIVNDYPELAPLCGGVHVGQEDLLRYGKKPEDAIGALRRLVGGGWIGLSTHNEDEILVANKLDIDYIGLGACRATGTKDDAAVLGMEKISKLASFSKHLVAVIGGVRLDDVISNAAYIVVGSALYED